MTDKTQRILRAAFRGARRGALVGFALPFVTGAAFSVVTQDIKWFFGIFTIGQSSHTVIVWSTVCLFSALCGAAHAGISVAAEIARTRAIEETYNKFLAGTNDNKRA